MTSLRKHLPFLLLLLAVAPLMQRFVWHGGLSSIADDSVAYLTLAQWLGGTASPFVREWVPYHTNFPPFFPMVLAASGGATNFLVAHILVGAFAIAALPMLYRYAGFQLASARAGLGVVVFFLLMPTAWTSIAPILSEPLYLLVSLAALHFHATRASTGRAPLRDGLILGALLGLAFLTRTAATALVAAYAVHALIAALSRPSGNRWPLLVAFLPLAAMAGLWMALRPPFLGENYGAGLQVVIGLLTHDPARLAFVGARGLASGWVASFASQPDVHVVSQVVVLAVGVLGACGAILRARRNALDGWYALAALAMLFLWFQTADTTRRLLYPLVPVLLVHAAGFVMYLMRLVPAGRASGVLPALVALPAVLVCLPALFLVHQKSAERAPVVAGFPQSFAGTTEFYTALSRDGSRLIAARNIAVLVGLQALQADTPPGAKVMWMRPDYVALLGNRQGVAWHYRGGLRGLAQDLQRSGAEFLIVSTLYKADLQADKDKPFESLDEVSPFAQPVSYVRNSVTGNNEFALLRVDAAALAAFLAR